jgi:predicted glycosyltransferase
MSQENRQRIAEIAARRDDMRVVTYVEEADLLMNDVQRVICMGGYNTLLSVVSFEKPALIVPRVEPRLEQLIRAQRFQDKGFVEMLHPDHLTPAALSDWLRRPVSHLPRRVEVDLNGLGRVVELVDSMAKRSIVAPSGVPSFNPERVR